MGLWNLTGGIEVSEVNPGLRYNFRFRENHSAAFD